MATKYKKLEISFRQLLWKSGFSDQSMKGIKEISEFLLVSERTIQRWMQNDRPSKQAISMLKNKENHLNDFWRNYKIKKDSIILPSGYSYTTNELEGLAIEVEKIKAFYNRKDN